MTLVLFLLAALFVLLVYLRTLDALERGLRRRRWRGRRRRFSCA